MPGAENNETLIMDESGLTDEELGQDELLGHLTARVGKGAGSIIDPEDANDGADRDA